MEQQNIIEKLQAKRNATPYTVYLPGLKRDIEFRQMSARQNKDLLSALMNNAKFQSEAPIVQHDILRDNLLSDIDLDSLGPADVITCIIGLRAFNYGKTFEIHNQDDETVETVDLVEHLEFLKSDEFLESGFDPDFTVNVSSDGVTAVIGSYPYGVDLNLSIYMKTLLDVQEKKSVKMDSAGHSNILSEIIGLQLLKHVRELNVSDDKEDMVILNSLPVKNLISIGDNLSSAFLTNTALGVVEFGKIAIEPVTTTRSGNTIEVNPDFFVL